MKHKSLIVANWKMYLPYDTVHTYFELYTQNLIDLAQNTGTPIVICPSAESLSCAREFLQNTIIMFGAQNCSEHAVGAYTGEISATSLKQLGCTYCLVGHHERRALFHETDDIIKHKVSHLLHETIIPIICIGETEQEYKQSKTLQVLSAQLAAVTPCYNPHQSILIAYEPVWAIGTGIIPEPQDLAGIIAHIHKQVSDAGHNAHVLYGGSINETTIEALTEISSLGGYLIGDASTDFKKLKNIVSLLY